MSLDTRRCLVVGATGGIGAALCHALAAQGASVLLSGRSTERLSALAAALPANQVLGIASADLTEDEDIVCLAETAKEAGVDTVVNVSGLNELSAFERQAPDQLRNLIDLNLTAPMRLLQEMLPALRAAQHGMIVNIGSAFGSIGFPGYVSYCATKFGLRGFTEALRRELADTSISVIYVAPRATATAMNTSHAQQMNRELGNHTDTPEAVAAQIVQAMQKRQRTTLLGWPEKLFARLNQILPGVVDKVMVKQLQTVRRHI